MREYFLSIKVYFWHLSEFLDQWFSTRVLFAYFLRVARASDKNIRNFFYILYFVYETTFCCSQNNMITWQKW